MVKSKRLAIRGEGGGIIRLELVANAAQVHGLRVRGGPGLSSPPVRFNAFRARKHRIGLPTQEMYPPRVISPASGPFEIAIRQGFGFRLLTE